MLRWIVLVPVVGVLAGCGSTGDQNRPITSSAVDDAATYCTKRYSGPENTPAMQRLVKSCIDRAVEKNAKLVEKKCRIEADAVGRKPSQMSNKQRRSMVSCLQLAEDPLSQ